MQGQPWSGDIFVGLVTRGGPCLDTTMCRCGVENVLTRVLWVVNLGLAHLGQLEHVRNEMNTNNHFTHA